MIEVLVVDDRRGLLARVGVLEVGLVGRHVAGDLLVVGLEERRGEPDRVVPEADELLAVQEDAVKDEDRVKRGRHPFGLEDRLVTHGVEAGQHEPSASRRVERVDEHPAQEGVVVGLAVLRRTVEPAGTLAVGARTEEIVDRGAEDFRAFRLENISEPVRELALARAVTTIHGDHGATVPVVVQDLVGDRLELVLLLRCPSSHIPRVVRVSSAPPDALGPPLADWYLEQARDLPWRAEGYSAWGILVSEVMLQQTPVARVIEPLAAWLARWPTPEALASVPAGEALRAWGRLGYPRRAIRLHACAVAIVDRHGGVVPDEVDDLLELPGIGEYTARAVAVFAYGRRHPVVDTNVRRVLARAVHGQAQPAPPSTQRDLADMEAQLPVAQEEARVVSAAIMELGAIICTSRAPLCSACPIADRCAWQQAGYPEYLGPTRAVQARYEGSDRQVRGLMLAELRASDVPVDKADLDALWPDAAQRERALAGLLADGLVTASESRYSLPD